MRTGFWWKALANVAISVVVCLMAVAAGHRLAQRTVGHRVAVVQTKDEEFTG
jgi:CrcB protein